MEKKEHLFELTQSGKIKLHNQNTIICLEREQEAERFIVDNQMVRFESFKNKAEKYLEDCPIL